MAITIPILTTFNGRGVDRGIAQFKSLGTKGQKAGFLIRKAALPAAAALGVLALAAKAGVQGVMEDDKALANLSSTLKATGNAANITANGFFEYANELQAATGVGADQITQGAALLGTFKNIRNEVGKGNDIFNRTTVAALDLSKKGFGSLESANKMLGKALNDPIAGITALSRAGVTFTDGQKKTIASLVASGKTLEAQKIILKEVESQVGGTAKAFGETTAGKIERGKRAFEELQKSLAKALLPAIEMFAGLLTKVSGFLQKNEGVVKVVAVAIAGLSAGILVLNAVMKIQNALMLASPFAWIALAIVGVTVAVVTLYKKSETFRQIVQKAWAGVKAAVKAVVDFFDGPVKAAWRVIEGAIKTIAALVKGDFSGAWDAFKGVVKGVIDWVKETLIALPATILTLAGDIGLAILNGIKNGVTGLAMTIWETIKGLPGYLTEKAAGWASSLKGIGTSILNWIKENVTGLAGKIWGQIKGFAKALADKVGEKASNIKGIGSSIIGWIGDGIKSAATSLGGIVKSAINTVIDGLNTGISGLNSAIDLLNKVNPFEDVPNIPKIPKLAKGGIVTRPTLALIGEAGPEAVIPLNSRHGFGRSQNITINVQAGLVSSPDQVGQQIIEAIQRAQRRSGPAFMPA